MGYARILARGVSNPGTPDDACVQSCEVCQRTKADHVGPSGLLHPLSLPSRPGGVIGVDWLLGLPMTAAGSTLGCNLTPFFIDGGQHPRVPLSLLDLRGQCGLPTRLG